MPKRKLIDFIHADYLAELTIKGIIVDRSGNPVAGAEVVFIDNGLDYIRSRDPFRWIVALGKASPTGRFARNFDYMWGIVAKATKPPVAAGTFVIRVQHPGYRPYQKSFAMEKLTTAGNRDLVDLGTVRLRKN